MGDIVRHEGMARTFTTHIRSLCYGSEDWQARHCFVLALLACTDLVYQSINAQARVALRLELLSEPMYPQGPKSSRLVWWWMCRALVTHHTSEGWQTSVPDPNTPHLRLLSVPEMFGKRGAADAHDSAKHVAGNAS